MIKDALRASMQRLIRHCRHENNHTVCREVKCSLIQIEGFGYRLIDVIITFHLLALVHPPLLIISSKVECAIV